MRGSKTHRPLQEVMEASEALAAYTYSCSTLWQCVISILYSLEGSISETEASPVSSKALHNRSQVVLWITAIHESLRDPVGLILVFHPAPLRKACGGDLL